MVKKIILILGLLLAVLTAASFAIEYFKNNPKTILNRIPVERRGSAGDEVMPKEGERLSYVVKYLWIIPVGVADIEVGHREYYKNRRIYPLIAKGRVSDFISRFIKAEGTIKSYVDVKGLYPWQYEESAQAEGHSPSIKKILYNQDAQLMEFEGLKRKIPFGTQDPLSALFYLRWQDYSEHKEIALNVNSNQENYTLLSKLNKRYTIGGSGWAVNLVVTDSVIKSPKRYSKSEARITTFMVDDATRIPLLFKIKTKFGPLIVRLEDID